MLKIKSLAMSLALSFTAALGLSPSLARAQDYPNRPIKFVVADGPGTNSDTLGRILGAEMAKTLGQPIVVENRAGASYRIGWEYAAKQPGDGYTIALVNIPGLVSLPLISKEWRLDVLKELPPIMGLVEGRVILAVPSSSPIKTWNDLIASAKAQPGKLNFGTSGTISRIPMEALKKTFGVDIVMVPYKAGAAYVQAVLGGEVQMGILGEQNALTFGDRVRVLAISGNKRNPQWPEVPAFSEIGMPPLVGNYFVLSAPAGTPKHAIEKIYAAGVRALEVPSVRAALAAQRFEVVPASAELAVKSITEQGRLYSEIGKAAAIQPE